MRRQRDSSLSSEQESSPQRLSEMLAKKLIQKSGIKAVHFHVICDMMVKGKLVQLITFI